MVSEKSAISFLDRIVGVTIEGNPPSLCVCFLSTLTGAETETEAAGAGLRRREDRVRGPEGLLLFFLQQKTEKDTGAIEYQKGQLTGLPPSSPLTWAACWP